MIKYRLICDSDHEFEGWFRNSSDYDAQSENGLLECPICGSVEVRKAMMAPAISSRSNKAPDPIDKASFLRSIAEAAVRARSYVEKNYDYVGDKFPEEARKIHYGESDERGIYGEATGGEVKELIEEGVSVAPLPGAKKEKEGQPQTPVPPSKKLN